MLHMVASCCHGGDDGGVGDGGGVVAEYPSGDDGCDDKGDVQAHGGSQCQTDGHHDGEGSPACTCAKCCDAGYKEDEHRHEYRGDVAVEHMGDVLCRTQIADDLTDEDGKKQDHRNGDHLSHSFEEPVKKGAVFESFGCDIVAVHADKRYDSGVVDRS